MNRMYKVIWNRAKQCYTVVSEIAVSCTKAPSGRGTRNTAAAVMAAMVLTGGLAFGIPEMVSAEAGNVTKGQYIAVKADSPRPGQMTTKFTVGNNTYTYHLQRVDGEEYWVREGYTIKIEHQKRFDGAAIDSIIKAYKTDTGEEVSKDILTTNQITTPLSGVTTLNGKSINDVNTNMFGGAVNTSTPITPANYNYYVERNGHWVDVGQGKETLNKNFKDAYYDKEQGIYTISKDDRTPIATNNLYVVDGRVGYFTTKENGGEIYKGNVYGKNNEILVTVIGDDGKYYSIWGARMDDPNSPLRLTNGQFNNAMELIGAQMRKYHEDDLKEIRLSENKVNGVANGGTISLITNGDLVKNDKGEYVTPKEGGKPIPGSIMVVSKQEKNDDVKIHFQQADDQGTWKDGFTVNAGSKVIGNKGQTGEDTTLKTLTINGKDYTIPQGKTYTAGSNVKITEEGQISATDTNTKITGGSMNGTNLKLHTNDGSTVEDIDLSSLKDVYSGTGAIKVNDNAISVATGNGIDTDGDKLAVKAGRAITVDVDGVSVNYGKGLKLEQNKIVVNPDEITLKYGAGTEKKKEVSLSTGLTFNNGKDITISTSDNGVITIGTTGLAAAGDLWKAEASGEEVAAKNGKVNFKGTDHITVKKTADGEMTFTATGLAEKGLGNITNEGNTVIKNLAKEAMKVVSGNNTTVEEGTEGDAKTYKVNVNKDLKEIHSINNVNIQEGIYVDNDTKGTIKIHALNGGKIGTLDLNNVHVTDQRVGNLSNTEWGGDYKITSGQAATEDQLQKAVKGLQDNVDGKEFVLTADKGSQVQRKLIDGIKIAGGKNISTVGNQKDGSITVALKDDINLNDTIKLNGSDGTISAKTDNHGAFNTLDFNRDGLTIGKELNGTVKSTTIMGDTITLDGGLLSKTILSGGNAEIGAVHVNGTAATVTGLSNTTTDYDGFASSGRAATEEQLKEIKGKAEQAQSSHTIVTAEGQTAPEGETYTDGNIQVKKTTNDKGQATYDVKLNDVITLGEDATRKITIDGNDSLITMGSTLNLGYQDDFINKGQFGYFLTGLSNTTFNIKDGGYKAYAGSSRAATEGQLYNAFDFLNQKIDGITIKGDDNIVVKPDNGKGDGSGTGGDGGSTAPGGNTSQDPKPSQSWEISLKDKITLGDDTHNVTIEGTQGKVTATNSFNVGGSSLKSDSLTVGGNKYITSNGIDANKQKITNVADGKISATSMDAVNGSQLFTVQQDVINNTQNISILNNRIGAVDKHVNEAAAGAAALAALHPLDFDPEDKLSFSAGYGRYKGEGSTALGAYYQPNENILVGTSTTIGNGDEMWNATVSFKLGSGSGLAMSRTAMAKKMASMEEENKDLRARVDLLSKQVEVLLNLLDTSKSKDFPDVPKNHWAYEAVSRLGGNGIVDGFPDGEFKGDRTLTRFEMAQMIYNALKQGAKAEARLVEEFRPELEAIASKDGK